MDTPAWVLQKIEENLVAGDPVLDLSRQDELDLSLVEIPSEVYQLIHLRELQLYSQGIQVVPAQLADLPNLQFIDLRKNPLQEIADIAGLVLDFGHWWRFRDQLTAEHIAGLWVRWLEGAEWVKVLLALPNLCWLDLSEQRLKTVPVEVWELTRLQRLDLSQNQLYELPESITQMQNLQSLNLNDNQLDTLPRFFWQLQNLQSLNLDDNQLNTLPASIAQLQNLQSLYLWNNRLSILPESIAQLQKLQSLDLEKNKLNTLPDSIAQLQNLQSFYLWNNQLSILPESIAQLQNLQSLSLGKNQLSILPESIAQLQNLQSLYLNDNQLSTLPESVAQLQNLQSLSLAGNQLSTLPESIAQLQKLQSLNLSWNQLSTLPESVAQLQNLQSLSLAGNQLSTLPESIAQLQNLQSLSLAGNQLSTLPEFITQLQNLQSLDLSFNQLSSLPKFIAQLQNLQSLDLKKNKLSILPEFTAQLKNLQFFDLRSNQLNTLPEFIAQLQNLQSLYLYDNQLSTLPESIAQLQNLQSLDLSENQLTPPESIAQLPNLQSLSLDGNQLSTLPESITQLPNLQSLSLDGNQLSTLPESIAQLPNLQSLYLNNNQLNTLPDSITQLQNLRKLQLKDLPLTEPPLESLDLIGFGGEADITKLWSYFRQLQETGETQLFEAKMLIIGEGGAGKTSLARKIRNQNAELPTQTDSTDGIDIQPYEFPLENNQKFRLNIWDFGGQEIFHSTHQFFFSKRALYALVADTRRNDTEFYWWLSTVELLAENSPVLLIKNEKDDRLPQIDEASLREHFDNLKESFECNLKTGKNLSNLIDNIQCKAKYLPHIGDKLPKTWVKVRQALETHTENTISLEQYLNLCEQHGFKRYQDKLQLSDYLHDLGVCLHFQNDDVLINTIILKPHWGTEAVYKVIFDKTVIRNHGLFSRADIQRIWHEPHYQSMHGALLQLMKNFKLCYELPAPETGQYIAPQCLFITPPDTLDWDNSNNLSLRYQYHFMPKGIVNRLSVELHTLIEQKRRAIWQRGVVLNDGRNTRAKIVEKPESKEIEIRLHGRDKRDFLTRIMHELDKINGTFKKLKCEKLLPCLCADWQHDPEYFKYSKLKEFAEERQKIQCSKRGCYEMLDARALLEGVLEKGGEVRQTEAKTNAAPSRLTVKGKANLRSKLKKYYDKAIIIEFFFELEINIGELSNRSLDELISELIKHSLNNQQLPKLLEMAAECCPNSDENWMMLE